MKTVGWHPVLAFLVEALKELEGSLMIATFLLLALYLNQLSRGLELNFQGNPIENTLLQVRRINLVIQDLLRGMKLLKPLVCALNCYQNLKFLGLSLMLIILYGM